MGISPAPALRSQFPIVARGPMGSPSRRVTRAPFASDAGRPRPDRRTTGGRCRAGDQRGGLGRTAEQERGAGNRNDNGNGSANRRRKTPREREFYRVLARPFGAAASGELDADGFLVRERGAVYDLYRDRLSDVWKLARVWD